MLTRTMRRRSASASLGAAMLEAIIVIMVFIVFLIGMIYFRVLFTHKLASMRLSRVAAVSYGMIGCSGSQTNAITPDLTLDTFAAATPIPATAGSVDVTLIPGAGPSFGQIPGSPVQTAAGTFQDQFADNITGMGISSTAAAGTTGNTWFSSTVNGNSYMSCGESPQAGSINDIIPYVKSLFKL
jgi:hypothetical protein